MWCVYSLCSLQKNEKESDIVQLQSLLLEQPMKLQNIILTQMLNNVPLIVGFIMLFNSMLLEIVVSETHSLGIVMIMGLVVGFTQYLSNVLHTTSTSHLNFDETTNTRVSATVDANTYRFVNKVAKHCLYIVVLSVVMCAYLVVTPCESFAGACHVTY